MEKTKTAFTLNVVLFALSAFASAWMMSGIGDAKALSSAGLPMLRFFTVDSNILMGIIALVAALDERRVLKGQKPSMSLATYLLKLMGTTSVALTMLVTVFFLTPTLYETEGLFGLFSGSNFFMHLVNPILAIVTFVGFEKTRRLRLPHALIGLAPMLVYAVYYVAEAVSHSENGVVSKGYDWYGFFAGGLQSAIVVVPVILLATFGISVALWKLNRRGARA